MRVRRIGAREDSSCGDDAEEEDGVVYLCSLNIAGIEEEEANIIERVQTHTISFLQTCSLETSYEFPNKHSRLVRGERPRGIFRIDVNLFTLSEIHLCFF